MTHRRQTWASVLGTREITQGGTPRDPTMCSSWGGGATSTKAFAPPTEITQWTEDIRDDPSQPSRPTIPSGQPHSGFATAIQKCGLGTQTSIKQDLDWQRAVGGDAGKITQWKEVMGNIQDFKAYLFIKQGSCFATVLHSPMKFAAINPATAHVQGRVIGFVGDRTATREPTTILLPANKTWQWVKETVFADSTALMKYFHDDPARAGTLWTGEGNEGAKVELHAPRLLAIPLWLLDRIRQAGKALMPYEILKIIMAQLDEVGTQTWADTWATVSAWCVLASQGGSSGNSLMSFSIEAITEVEDEYLGKWLEQRLDTTMGPRSQGGSATGTTLRGQPTAHLNQATLAADIGKGVALGLKALGGPIAAAQAPTPTTEGDAKTRYTEDDIAAIMGFSHVHRGDQVQLIWATLNNAKQKNLDTFRRQLLSRMTEWG